MKLLNRTIKNYSIFSFFILLISAPLFYISFQYLLLDKIDEELREHKEEFIQSIPMIHTEDDIRLYELMNKELKITSGGKPTFEDEFITYDLYDSLNATAEPHRKLTTSVELLGKPYTLEIIESLVSSEDLITAIMSIHIFLLILLLAGMVMINHRLAKVIWGPFYLILEKLKSYNIEQDKPIQLPPSSTSEFREFNAIISQLLKENRRAYQAQKEFTENASHEMLTPLAVVNSQIDMLMQTPLTEAQAKYIHSLQDTMGRLSRINKSLLLLAKIDNQQFSNHEVIDAHPLIKKLIEQYDDQCKQKGLVVSLNGSTPFIISANPILSEILFSNLLSNAVRHSPPGTTIQITLQHKTFTISNQGKPIINPEKIFDRFHQENLSGTGSGLGLSIVKKICDLNDYTVDYSYEEGHHFFKINFFTLKNLPSTA